MNVLAKLSVWNSLVQTINPLSNLDRISPYNYQYNIKETSDENKEKYQWGDYSSIQSQILLTNII